MRQSEVISKITGRPEVEYRNVDISTLKGLKEAEKLHNAGWTTGRVGLFIIEFYRVKP